MTLSDLETGIELREISASRMIKNKKQIELLTKGEEVWDYS